MQFLAGDKVKFLDEVGSGIVISTRMDGIVKVFTEDGFELVVPEGKLILMERSSLSIKGPEQQEKEAEEKKKIKETPFDPEEVLRLKEQMYTKPKVSRPAKTLLEDSMEVDLHIEELLDSITGMSNAEIITIQLSQVRIKMEEAMAAHMRRIIFIHGVGNGRLKSEIIRILREDYPSCEFYDASMSKYGFGATEVRLK